MAQEDWLAHANPLPAFIREECTKYPGVHVPLKDFYNRLIGWIAVSGIRYNPARNNTKSNLENLGYEVRHQNTGAEVYGLELIEHQVSLPP